MGDLSATILAQEEGGTNNFLLPNGTFIFVLLIFLVVLAVIAKFVVPPISSVLNEREAMLDKTNEDNRKSAELSAATQADSRKVMTEARREASTVRDEARGEGRKIIEDMRIRASAEAGETLQQADDKLTEQGRETTAELQSSIESLSATLASRVLGVAVAGTTSQGR
ncbi:MAG: F0F1 ATP synthase subunit B [Actinomycetia bacterium]|nr:F0F1 ATP synthase subunit B [Actinomycetes bacterium]MCH9709038.1 F0F1 ATP synthase subunit B [Actinomycetes bacterium]MCH9759583.1 F0F1 ATP synthase subunit B [Actinomycetes bacterium]